MQGDDTSTAIACSKRQPVLSLCMEEEMENVSTTAASAERSSTAGGQVNSWEISSTSEATNQPTSSTNKSSSVNLYEKDTVGSRIDNVSGTSASSVTREHKKPNPGLQLLREYTDSGNDTEEEAATLRKAAEEKAKELATVLSNKNKISNVEHVVGVGEVANNGRKSQTESVRNGVTDSGNEKPTAEDKVPSPISRKGDLDNHDTVAGDRNFAKLERSTSKEEGQISGDSDSNESEISSLSGKGSKNQMEGKKDKSRKNKKKKKKKKRKQKHSVEKRESQSESDEEKSEKKRSRENSDKNRQSFKQSRSQSRERRDSRHRHYSRGSSKDNRKHRRHSDERSNQRSRSRSASRRHSAKKRQKDLKSKSKSPKRNTSPHERRKDTRSKHSSSSRNKRVSPSLEKKRASRSPSPQRSSERKRSRSPRRETRSPARRRRISTEKSPSKSSSRIENTKTSKRRHRKGTPSSRRKSSHRTSSASDSLDSGHYTNIPLSKVNKSDELLQNNLEESNTAKPASTKEDSDASNLPRQSVAAKPLSPAASPAKPWDEEMDLVFTEHMSPKQGMDESMEDVLFGSVAKTPEFKRPTPGESKKSKPRDRNNKKESKTGKLSGIVPLADKESKLPQNVNGSSNLKSQPETVAILKHEKTDKSMIKASKSNSEDNRGYTKKSENDAKLPQASGSGDKLAFTQTKAESIPFLDEASFITPPVKEVENTSTKSPLSILDPPLTGKGRAPPMVHDSSKTSSRGNDSLPIVSVNKSEFDKGQAGVSNQSVEMKDRGEESNYFAMSPLDMEMSSPEGDIIDQMNEEFWKQQQLNTNKTGGQSKQDEADAIIQEQEQSFSDDPYEPESRLLVEEEMEDLENITDPKERKKRLKQKEKERTKVQELLDRLHRQARVEEEVKHALKAYYKHRDITKDEYKGILRRAVPQVTNSSSAIDPERIRSLVKKYVAKIKGQRVESV